MHCGRIEVLHVVTLEAIEAATVTIVEGICESKAA
jgi:hypothetical protein